MRSVTSDAIREVLVRIANPTAHDLTLVVEPWGDSYTLAPGVAFDIRAEGPASDTLEVKFGEDSVVVWGWPGSVLDVTDAAPATLEVTDRVSRRRRVEPRVQESHGLSKDSEGSEVVADTSAQEPEYLSIVRRESCTNGSLTWLAYHPDLSGCMAHGDTPEEALAGLSEARGMMLRHLREQGIAPPAPGSSKIAQAVLAAG